MVLENQVWSLKSPWGVLKKWLQLFVWTLLEFSLFFTVPDLLICQKKICESVPADSTLVYDCRLELSWDVHFFYLHPPKDDWNPNPQIFVGALLKRIFIVLCLPFRKIFERVKISSDRKIQIALFGNPSSSGGQDKNWTFHRQRIKSEQKLLIDP